MSKTLNTTTNVDVNHNNNDNIEGMHGDDPSSVGINNNNSNNAVLTKEEMKRLQEKVQVLVKEIRRLEEALKEGQPNRKKRMRIIALIVNLKQKLKQIRQQIRSNAVNNAAAATKTVSRQAILEDFLKANPTGLRQPNGIGSSSKKKKKQQQQEKKPLFPQVSLTENFYNSAIRDEVNKHDRLLVHSIGFMRQLFSLLQDDEPMDFTKKTARNKYLKSSPHTKNALEYWSPRSDNDLPINNKKSSTAKLRKKRKVCVIIFTASRILPYIDAILTMLMEGNDPLELDQTLEIHLLHSDTRENKPYPYLDQLAKLPLIYKVHSNQSYSHKEAEKHRQASNKPGLAFYVQQKMAFIKGLDICRESELDFCLVMEDDAIPARHFVSLLQRFVLQPLTSSNNNGIDFATMDPPVSLYNYKSHLWAGNHRLDTPSFVHSGFYDRDRAMTNAERRNRGLPPHVHHFDLVPCKVSYGAVAELYSKRRARQLQSFLENLIKEWWDQWKRTPPKNKQEEKEEEGKLYNKNLDIVMHGDFLKSIRESENEDDLPPLKRYTVAPMSLMNHLGFYSEIHQILKPPVNTDVGFVVDYGEYDYSKVKRLVQTMPPMAGTV